MAYSKVKFKNNENKSSPCFRSCWIGNVSDKHLSIRKGLRHKSWHNIFDHIGLEKIMSAVSSKLIFFLKVSDDGG
jgi:hypothetical protein